MTAIKIDSETKSQIDYFYTYERESYDEVLQKLIYIVKNVSRDIGDILRATECEKEVPFPPGPLVVLLS